MAVAQYAEDLCFDDLDDRPGYRRYTSAAELWPPSHECRLSGATVEPVAVQHRGVAIARFGAVVVPVAYLAVAAVASAVIMRRIGASSQSARPASGDSGP